MALRLSVCSFIQHLRSYGDCVLVIEDFTFRADPLAVNREQYSALHLASMYSREDTIKVTSVVVVNLLAVMGVFVDVFLLPWMFL